MALKAVLFDMDGVIVDTEPLHKKAYFQMFYERNIEVSDAMYHGFTGQSTLKICRYLCEHFQINANPEELVLQKRHKFHELFKKDPDLSLISGVRERIEEYHENGLTLVLASSASMGTINAVFDRFNLNPYFKAKLSGADLKASKPHPEIFLKAAQAAEKDKENCVVIEDSTNGILAAKAARLTCVGYDSIHSKDQNYDLADKVITHFDEIAYPSLKQWFLNKKIQ
ncbi:MAG: HAD-IA family hydrolase [Flavobacteriaceae bacterium]|nr:HAD-IA family hydrolase [Flavobacteriaceae bacterium]